MEDIKWLDESRGVASCDNDRILLLPDTRPTVDAGRVGLDHRLLSGPSLVKRVVRGGDVAPHDARRPLAMVVKFDIGLAPINRDVSRCLSASEDNLTQAQSRPPLPQRTTSGVTKATTMAATPPPVLPPRSSLMMEEEDDDDEDGVTWPPAAAASATGPTIPESPLVRPPRRLLLSPPDTNGGDPHAAFAGAGGQSGPGAMTMPSPATRMTSPVMNTVSPKITARPSLSIFGDAVTDTLASVDPRVTRWVAPRKRQQSANIMLSREASVKDGNEFVLFALTLDTVTEELKFQVTSQTADYNLPWTTIPEELTDVGADGAASPMSVVIGLMEDGVVAVSVSGVLLSVVHLPEAPSKPTFVTLASRDARFRGSGAFVTSVSTAWLPIPDPSVSGPLLETFRHHYMPGWLSVTGTLVEDTVDLTVEDLWRRLQGNGAHSDIAMRLDATGVMVALPDTGSSAGAGAGAGAGDQTTKKRRRTARRGRSMSATCLGAFVQHGPLGGQPRLRLFIHTKADVAGIVGVSHTSLTLMKPLRATLGSVFNTDESLRVQRVSRDLFRRLDEQPGTMRASHDDPAFPSFYFEDTPLE